ncbi:Uncharacterized protein TCM_024268 [Theobroma cacao]|uniref:Integrase catalytic domain-containing protein n=1 Tax=Theobroma cacao TaxID=3641 RepID=A0A061EWC9_THECC|nr:Uncharacterized protein TCM_024268 [Theobroma cacao]
MLIVVVESQEELCAITVISRAIQSVFVGNSKISLIKDLATKQIIGKGCESGGLYYLDTQVPRSIACSSVLTPFEVHCRLGHPSLSSLKKLCPQFQNVFSLDCESCPFAKHHRLPSVSRVNKRVVSTFELVHSDVWGPCPIVSKSSFKYFATFVDDYSRVTWRYLMKNHSKLFFIFCAFCAEIKTQFNVFVHKLRIDNAKEYFFDKFQSYMIQNGILHQSSYIDTPSQNRVAERKINISLSYDSQGEEDDLLVYTITHSVNTTDILATDPAPAQPPIVHVYSKRPEAQTTCPLPVPSPSDLVSNDHEPSLHLPIALRKGKCQCTYPISSFVSYDHLSFSSGSFVASLDSISIPKTVHEALSHPGWRAAMVEEMVALDGNCTWDSVDLPAGKKAIGCKWVLAVKVDPNGSVASLVAKGYAQTYSIDYFVTFSPVAKLTFVRLFISMVATYDWPLHQLDIKNAFLHGDLQDEVYMEQPLGLVAQGEYGKVCHLQKCLYGLKQSPRAWFGKFSEVVQEFGMKKSKCDHSVFYKQSEAGIILLVVYVDDIVITGSDTADGELFEDSEKYRGLVGKLNYLTVTRPDIAYSVSVVNQFMSDPTINHWTDLKQILCYLKGAPGCGLFYGNHGHTNIECFSNADWASSKSDRRSTTRYCVFIGGNLVLWKSKKQNVVSRSSAKSEYKAMAQTVCEAVFMYQLLSEVGLKSFLPAKLLCDNQAALHIASNPVFHERNKHIEIDCHFVREKIQHKFISTRYVKTEDQLGDIFTNALNGPQVDYIRSKLGMINIYAPA